MNDIKALTRSWASSARERLTLELRRFTESAVDELVGAVLNPSGESVYDERPKSAGDAGCRACAADRDAGGEDREALDEDAARLQGAGGGRRGRRAARRHRRRNDGAADSAPDAGDERSEPVAG